MFLITGITLYTSRIVLKELGVSDFGIYSIVGGIVAMLGVLNSAMATATQRYLSFDLGLGDFEKLKRTFCATLSIHIGIAIFVLILTETLGLWYVNNKMVFPQNRLYAVNVIYQFSIFTLLLSIVQVPYNALILARERMKVYAYVSIIEASLKLMIVFMLGVFGSEKLITYSILTFVVAFIVRIIYQIYCRRHFPESKFQFKWEVDYFRELVSYSGWNLFGSIAVICRNQGSNMLLNLFFGTVVNASYGITNQVQAAVSMFVTNFQSALNPQIIKSYALDDKERMYDLICKGSKLSFFLVLLMFFPLYYNIDYILSIWLVNAPEYSNKFIRLALIVIGIDCLSGPLMVGAQATGKIKYYQIVVGFILFLNLPLSYVLLKGGFARPEIVYYVSITMSILAFAFRIVFLKKMIMFPVGYYFRHVILVICLIVLICVGIYTFCIPSILTMSGLRGFVFSSALIFIVSILLIIILGLNVQERAFLTGFFSKDVKNKS